ncbi:MAG: glycosyltransferase family 2 protein [bacterium]
MSKVFIVLPAYNEEKCLPALLASIIHTMKRHPLPFKIIVVDDGSADKTAEVAQAAGKLLRFRLVRHEKNMGLGPAIKTGLRAALEESSHPDDIIINMDADNTHPPEHIPDMIRALQGPYDIVIASRYQVGSLQVGVPFHRQLLSLFAKFLFQIFLRLPNVRDYTCGYRGYRVGLLRRAFDAYGEAIISREGFACTDELLVHLSTMSQGITEVPFILRYDRKEGKSKLQLRTTVWATLKLLWAYRRIGRRQPPEKSLEPASPETAPPKNS